MLQETNLFVVLSSTGLLIQFGLQAIINMASSLHLIPTKGMTLPFVSYGGSSLVALAPLHRHAAGAHPQALERRERRTMTQQPMPPRLIALASGGTGGHMFPAQALADQLIRQGFAVALV